MKYLVYILVLISTICLAQETSFDKMIDTTLQKTIPFIHTSELKTSYDEYVILDAREATEYATSHLKNATCVGYNNFKLKRTIQQLDKSKPVVVYCSIGYRSEKIAEKIQRKGYTVYNLYGGIFDWKNQGNIVMDNSGLPTENVHVYSEDWGKWLLKGKKIYD